MIKKPSLGNDINSKRTQEERRRGLIYVVSLITLLIAINSYIYVYNNDRIDMRIESEQILKLDEIERVVQNELRFASNPLVIFSDSDCSKKYLEELGVQEKQMLSNTFISIISKMEIYNQIRLIDSTGNEVIRVDRNMEGDYFIIPDSELQNKCDRYYFTETVDTPSDTIYMSPFDLNVEHGEVEIPYKPMIRLGKKIVDENEETLGIMILNVMGQHLLDAIINSEISKENQVLLLNEEGYYLLSDDINKDFSFMFADKKDIGFFSDYPDVWTEIKNEKYTLETEQDRFYVKSIVPINQEYYNAIEKKWYIVIRVPLAVIRGEDKGLVISLMIAGLILYPLFVFLAWQLGIQQVRSKNYKKELISTATTDGLTGLYNRNAIIDKLMLLMGLARRNKTDLAIVFIDINDLKYVNDKFGHRLGDEMLISASKSLLKSIRSTDLVARLGGDEFLLVLPHCDVRHVDDVMERALEKFEEDGMRTLNIPWIMSYGCALLRDDEDVDEFISRADKLMYEDKQRRKGAKTNK